MDEPSFTPPYSHTIASQLLHLVAWWDEDKRAGTYKYLISGIRFITKRKP